LVCNLSCMQYYEYCISSIFIDNGIVSSSLYLSSLHGTHLIVIIVLLSISSLRLLLHYFYVKHNIGFVISVYSRHFVYIVWIFVYLTQYLVIAYILLDWLLNFIYLATANDAATQFLSKLALKNVYAARHQIKTIDDITDSDIE